MGFKCRKATEPLGKDKKPLFTTDDDDDDDDDDNDDDDEFLLQNG